jgi:hypothetical protein
MTSLSLVREGTVVSHDGDTTELLVSTGCLDCQSRCLMGAQVESRIRFNGYGHGQPTMGDRVRIAVSRSELTRLCAVLFGGPLAAWVCGATLGNHFWGESGGMLLAPLMLTAALFAIRANRQSLRHRINPELIPSHAVRVR